MRRWIYFLTAAICLLGTSKITYASENNVTVYMLVLYATSVTPTADDMFVITYKDNATGDTATIEFDASELNGKAGGMEIKNGTYEITNISYEGENKGIMEQGYAVNTAFSADSEDIGTFTVAIGTDEINNLKKVNDFVLVGSMEGNEIFKKQDSDVSESSEGVPTSSSVNIPTDPSESSESGNEVDNTGYGDVPENEDVSDSSFSEEVDVYGDDYEPYDSSQSSQVSEPVPAPITLTDDDQESYTSVNDSYSPSAKSLFFKGLPAFIFGILGALTIFILHKKGKI